MDQLRLAGTSAFGSRTKREGRVASGLDPTTVHPNPSPDSYEMQTVLSLAKQAARSINKKSADGHLGFIGQEARVLNQRRARVLRRRCVVSGGVEALGQMLVGPNAL